MLAADILEIEAGTFEVKRWTTAPLQLEKRVRLNWPLECVFDLLADHKRWPRIFPWLQEIEVDNTYAVIEDGLGARRTCYMGNGMRLEEVIVGWQPPLMYAYAGLDETHPFGMREHVGIINCSAIDDQHTRLSWQHYFHHANPAAMRNQLDSSLSAAVQSLVTNCGGFLEETIIHPGLEQ